MSAHADRDGSERRELEAYLAADKAEPIVDPNMAGLGYGVVGDFSAITAEPAPDADRVNAHGPRRPSREECGGYPSPPRGGPLALPVVPDGPAPGAVAWEDDSDSPDWDHRLALAQQIADTADQLEAAEARIAELEAENERQAVLLCAINDCHRDPARAILQADRIAGEAILSREAAERALAEERAKVARVEAALDIRTRAVAWMEHLGYEPHQIAKAEAWRQPREPWLQDDPPQHVRDLSDAADFAREYAEVIRAALAGPANPEASEAQP